MEVMDSIEIEMNDILNMMIEIEFPHPESFLKIKETLTRIGVSNTTLDDNRLYPSVVLLHKRGKYYLSHFKLLFALDGKTANISSLDLQRAKTIAHLISEWGLCSIVDSNKKEECAATFNPKLVKVIPYREKDNWTIIEKYSVGSNSKKDE